MFAPSDKALEHLCNALLQVRWPFGNPYWTNLLVEYGLADAGELLDVPLECFTREVLLRCLGDARHENAEGLRGLCSRLLRQKDELQESASDRLYFSDCIAQLEIELEKEGYKFDEVTQVIVGRSI